MANAKIRTTVARVAEFVGLEGAIDWPLQTYSSGMTGRSGLQSPRTRISISCCSRKQQVLPSTVSRTLYERVAGDPVVRRDHDHHRFPLAPTTSRRFATVSYFSEMER